MTPLADRIAAAFLTREVIPERRMHGKGWGRPLQSFINIYHPDTTTHAFTKAKIFSERQQTPMLARSSVVAGERGCRRPSATPGFALKFYNPRKALGPGRHNTPVFVPRSPLRFPYLNHAIKRDQHRMRSADNNWDFWDIGSGSALHRLRSRFRTRGIPKSFPPICTVYGSHTSR